MVAFKKTWWWKWDSSSSFRRVEWSKNPNENDDLFSRTKIYQKVFVGTHFLILIFDFKLKGLSKMTDRFCEGKKISSSTAQQQAPPLLLLLIFDLLIKQDWKSFQSKEEKRIRHFCFVSIFSHWFLFCTYRIGGWYFWPSPNAMIVWLGFFALLKC